MMIKDEMVYNGSRDSCIYREKGKVLGSAVFIEKMERFWVENQVIGYAWL